MHDFDYVIVGAGSAGCVLANRLSENPANRVALLEAGGSDRHVLVQMPSALSYPMANPLYNWGYWSEPEPYLDGRQIDTPRGKGLGGTSSINGMVYVRGHRCDFDEWEALGADGWGYADCLPYYKKAESWAGGEDTYRGGNGPLGVSNGNKMTFSPLYTAFISAGEDAGYPVTDDYNGYAQEGFGAMHMTVRGGVRESTSRAYLKPARRRPNLSVITDALVDKVVLDGKRATALRFFRHGAWQEVSATKEIILSAGAFGSPNLLERSGIGAPDTLKGRGIEVTHALAGVGENLQDHLEVYFQFACNQPITLNSRLGLLSKAWIGARWLATRTGLGATNHFESCAFIRSKAGQKWPDIQYHFLPAAMRYDGTAAFNGHGFQVHVGPNKPKSRGHVHIRSADPHDAPAILFNYLQHQDDVEDWRRCIRLTREIIAQPAMDAYRGDEIQPGVDVTSDDAIDAWVKDNVESAYHPTGSCRMGRADDTGAVVDSDCRVIGVESLRVVDSSIFPTVLNGNINAPTIMAAEKASDAILGKAPLPRAQVDTWIDPEWETRQRVGTPKRG